VEGGEVEGRSGQEAARNWPITGHYDGHTGMVCEKVYGQDHHGEAGWEPERITEE